MAKQPIVGRTKSRLCPPLKPEEAVEVYKALLCDTIDLVLCLEQVDKGIALTPSGSIAYFRDITMDRMRLIPVDCGDIGECLDNVMSTCLDEGYKKVIALNSDGPSIPGEYINKANELLENFDLVIGPSNDGGYYLIGMKARNSTVFKDIEWSTSKVLTQTLNKVLKQGQTIALLPLWFDVDTHADLERLKAELIDAPDSFLVHTRRALIKIDQ